MGRRKKTFPVFNNVTVADTGAKGKAIARINNQVIFVPFVVPGDEIDIQITRNKRSYLEGRATKIHKYSAKRTEPNCSHFGICGGCKWQNMNYHHQLFYKQKQVEDNLRKIARIETSSVKPIMASEEKFYYRNKLEFTFLNRRWLTEEDGQQLSEKELNGLGFHLPGRYNRILDIKKCYLQKEPSNQIRDFVKNFANENDLDFYDIKKQEGFLRNLIIRTSETDQLMLIIVFGREERQNMTNLLEAISEKFQGVTSLHYVINKKVNDDINDQDVIHYKKKAYIIEEMPRKNKTDSKLKFIIGPKSFYQTNSKQAYQLYCIARDFAGLKGNEIVYDLYTGTGTIANFVADNTRHTIGLEYVDAAIEDAEQNSVINNINNTSFYAGDIKEILTDELISRHGKPDVIITDPPRAGMHEKVVKKILSILPKKIVYISCNPATQARDIFMLKQKYDITAIQPVDMFPHTSHVENVVLLEKMI